MRSKPKKKSEPASLLNRLSELEEKTVQKGIHIHYDLLEAAGLKLKGGLCRIRGEYHLFIDKRKSAAGKIELLLDCLNQPLNEDIPEISEGPHAPNGEA
jgi:hypothetical protein